MKNVKSSEERVPVVLSTYALSIVVKEKGKAAYAGGREAYNSNTKSGLQDFFRFRFRLERCKQRFP